MKYNPINSTSSSISSGVIGGVNYYTSTGTSLNIKNPLLRPTIDTDQLIEYIDLLYQIIGVDITFEKWSELSTSEKISLIRDIKLNKVI